MVEKKTMSYTVRKSQTAKHCKTCILSVQLSFHYFMYFCWSKYFPWIQKLFSSKLFDWYSQLSWWSPPLAQIKQWQWPAQDERYLHCQSERKMEFCKSTIDCGQSYGVIIQMQPLWRYFYMLLLFCIILQNELWNSCQIFTLNSSGSERVKREVTVIKEEIKFWDKSG